MNHENNFNSYFVDLYKLSLSRFKNFADYFSDIVLETQGRALFIMSVFVCESLKKSTERRRE